MNKKLLPIIVFLLTSFSLFAQLPEYKWENLKIGGGGYVTGIVIHPLNKDIKYIRTDVGGAYRWNKDTSKWQQMLGWINPENSNLIGVDGIAIDPSNPDRIYLALGQRIEEDGGLFRSEDRGTTWTKLLDVSFEGNGRNARWIGECIAIDPVNSSIIYVGTRRDGLWRSVDDGVSWSKIPDVPEGYTGVRPTGIRSIVMSPQKNNSNHSELIYVGIPSYGIFYSEDSGETFKSLEDAPLSPARMQLVHNELFVTHSKGAAIYSDMQWQDITPEPGKNYVALAVNETDPKQIIVGQRYGKFYNPIFRSKDKGQKWEEINTSQAPASLNVSVPWWPKTRFSSATSAMAMAPGGSGELYYTDWFGVWQSPDIWADSIEWNTIVDGHEETVVLSLVSPPAGPLLYSGVADVSGFIHTNTLRFPDKKISAFNECFSIAVSETKPAYVAHLGATSWNGDQTTLLISENYGDIWTKRKLPEGEKLGRIALSSVNPEIIVYVSGRGNVYFSIDAGENWVKSKNAPDEVILLENIWNRNKVLVADSEDESFYIIKDGVLYTSDDGNIWVRKNHIPVPHQVDRFLNLNPVPGRSGELWISSGKGGLWKTTDKGETVSQDIAFENARLMCWGAPAPGTTLPTAYVYGTVNSEWGIYRSTDMGERWVRINDENNQFPAGVAVIDGDKNIFGRIYVGSGGYGISYGEPVEKK